MTMDQTVQGVASRIPAGSQLWIVIHAHIPTNRYYPQREPITPDLDGKWLIRDINVGNTNDASYKFDIMAILANKSAQSEFIAYINESNKAANWPGMARLPVGAEEYYTVTVMRI